jgi:hypothetical protein
MVCCRRKLWRPRGLMREIGSSERPMSPRCVCVFVCIYTYIHKLMRQIGSSKRLMCTKYVYVCITCIHVGAEGAVGMTWGMLCRSGYRAWSSGLLR